MNTIDCFAYKSGLERLPHNLPLCVTCVDYKCPTPATTLEAVPPNILWDRSNCESGDREVMGNLCMDNSLSDQFPL